MPDVIAVGNGVKTYSLDSLQNWSDLGITPWATGSGQRSTTQLAASVAFLFRAVNLRAAALADVPWTIYKGETALWESDETMPDALAHFGDIEELLYRTEAALCLTSTAYWYKLRNRVRVTGLQWLDPTATAPYLSLTGEITWFDHSAANGLQRFAIDDVVYIWNRGIGEVDPAPPPAAAAAQAAQALYNTNAFVRAFFERGAIKATLLTVEGAPSLAEKEKLKSWWARMMGGVRNAFATEVISAAVKPVVIGEGISELSNTALTAEQREDIATALGVPHSLLMSNAANFATAQADRLTFYDTTIIPECNSIARQINRQLFAPLGLRFVWRPEAMNIYQENEQERAAAFAAYVAAGMPLSVTVRLLGIDLPEGVEPEDLDPEPQPEPAPPPADAPEPAQDAPAMHADDTQAANAAGKSIEAAQFRRWLKKRTNANLRDFEAHYLSPVELEALAGARGVATEQPPFAWPESITPEWVKAMVLQLDPGDDGAEQVMRMASERRMASNLGNAFDEWLARHFHPDLTEAQARMLAMDLQTPQEVLDAIERGLIDAADIGVSVAVAQLEGVGFGFDFTLANIHAREAAQRYSYDLVRGIEETTRRGLQEAVGRWTENGQPLDALRRDIEPLFGSKRARLIAATESTRAYQSGAEAAYTESGVVGGMTWQAVADERICPVCGALHGTEAPLGGTWGGLKPPAHPGCRCFARPVLKEP